MSAMSTSDRAKQFLPFNALKGFDEAVAKRQKLDFEPVLLGEDAAAELDAAIRSLMPGDSVRLIYYGDREYNEIRGRLKTIDHVGRRLEVEDEKIRIDDVISAEREDQ